MAYIEDTNLIEEIKSLKISIGGKDIFPDEAKESVLRVISEQPTADVVEVKHGEWIKHKPNKQQMKEFHDMGIGKGMALNSIYWTCSSCGQWGTPRYKYCPFCGAKMSESPTGSERVTSYDL